MAPTPSAIQQPPDPAAAAAKGGGPATRVPATPATPPRAAAQQQQQAAQQSVYADQLAKRKLTKELFALQRIVASDTPTKMLQVLHHHPDFPTSCAASLKASASRSPSAPRSLVPDNTLRLVFPLDAFPSLPQAVVQTDILNYYNNGMPAFPILDDTVVPEHLSHLLPSVQSINFGVQTPPRNAPLGRPTQHVYDLVFKSKQALEAAQKKPPYTYRDTEVHTQSPASRVAGLYEFRLLLPRSATAAADGSTINLTTAQILEAFTQEFFESEVEVIQIQRLLHIASAASADKPVFSGTVLIYARLPLIKPTREGRDKFWNFWVNSVPRELNFTDLGGERLRLFSDYEPCAKCTSIKHNTHQHTDANNFDDVPGQCPEDVQRAEQEKDKQERHERLNRLEKQKQSKADWEAKQKKKKEEERVAMQLEGEEQQLISHSRPADTAAAGGATPLTNTNTIPLITTLHNNFGSTSAIAPTPPTTVVAAAPAVAAVAEKEDDEMSAESEPATDREEDSPMADETDTDEGFTAVEDRRKRRRKSLSSPPPAHYNAPSSPATPSRSTSTRTLTRSASHHAATELARDHSVFTSAKDKGKGKA